MTDTLEKRLYDVIERKDNLNTIEQLLKPDLDYNLSYFDPNTNIFRTLIQLAIQTEQDSVLQRLYEQRNSPTKAQIDKYLQFYINHYNPSQKEQNKILFDFIISRLLYTYIITEHEPKVFGTLIAALHDYDGVRRRRQDLCQGSTHRIYLQLRIYTLFQMITDRIIERDSHKDTFNILINELLHNLETYYFLNDILQIPELTQEMIINCNSNINSSYRSLITYYKAIAKNVIKKIEQLEPQQEYTIPTGWVGLTLSDQDEVLVGHAVCISFRRINDTHIIIRVDNPSPSNPSNPSNPHEIRRLPDDSIEIKPKVLGQIRTDNIQKNLTYFTLLIHSIKRDLSLNEGVQLIYNQNRIIQGLNNAEPIEDDLPFFDEQAKANCFLKCYEPGSLTRFGGKYPKLYQELVLCQQNNANLLVKRCEEEYGRYCSQLIEEFVRLAKEPLPDYLDLQQRLKRSCLQNHQYMLREITGQSDTQLTKSYIPLRFEINKIPMKLKDFFSDQDKSRVLLVADAGCGKSTLCQYVTYLWAKEELWSEQYEWLFHIKMRELNSLNYSSQSQTYSLIDIIETECFPGYKLNHIEKLKLKYLFENPSKILWILDGCDERAIPDYLTSIERELFAKRNLLLTSRSYQTYQLPRDKEFKIQKFNYEDIENYIKNYFDGNDGVRASECLSAIKYYDGLKEIV